MNGVNDNWQLIDFIQSDQQPSLQNKELIKHMPIFEAFSLIYWALDGKKQGNGYGFPFDRPHFEFVKWSYPKIVDTPKSKIVKRNRRCVYGKNI